MSLPNQRRVCIPAISTLVVGLSTLCMAGPVQAADLTINSLVPAPGGYTLTFSIAMKSPKRVNPSRMPDSVPATKWAILNC